VRVLLCVNLKHTKRKWHYNDSSIPFLPRNAMQSAVIIYAHLRDRRRRTWAAWPGLRRNIGL